MPRIPLLLLLSCVSCVAQTPRSKPAATTVDAASTPATIAAKTAAMQHMPGLLPLDWDAKAGKLYLEIPRLNVDLLYTDSLPYGTGSNDLGLDRGQTAAGRIVRFERVGPKVSLAEPNVAFRGSTTEPAEQLSIRQSFPESVLAGFKVEAEDPSGAVLIDATEFFLSDVHHVSEALARTQQGVYKVDPARSTITLDGTKAFPMNTEVEAILTFTTEGPARGEFIRDVTPDAHALTVREHQSFLALPGVGFLPRRFDPRAGYFPASYRDYSTPLGEPLEQQFILRHRLRKKDPACQSVCVPEQPIQYYVDRGAPEPIRSALVEGARWWDQAFQAAGWAPGTFLVDVLPADRDPMDSRINIIQWVHRYTRGWSYGAAVADPRTGEIIKGNVTLGSLRGRQDYLIAEALLSPYVTGRAMTPANDPMLAMVLQRIRQLAAHETGHTLGLAHNFAASAFSPSASVMDYPHPYITLGNDGVPDVSHAYAVDIGQWDKVAIDYGYREFPPPLDEHAELSKILSACAKTGLIFVTDEDARPPGGAHPHAHLWDNGADPAAELHRIIGIRTAALARFGENAIRPGTPVAQLADTLVPLYLLHRYQTEAAIKEIGGLDYRYNLRGDGQMTPEIVSAEDQNKALRAVMKTLSPGFLTLPEPLLRLIPPRPPGLERTREALPSETGLTFDPVGAAESAADLTLSGLLNPERASRMVQYRGREEGLPSLHEMLDAISGVVAERPVGGETLASEVGRAVEFSALEAMLSLAVDPAASSQVRAICLAHVTKLASRLSAETGRKDVSEEVHRAAMRARIEVFLRDPPKFVPAKPVEAPPGMPIGDEED